MFDQTDSDSPLILPIKDPLYELWMERLAAESIPNAQAVVAFIKSRIQSAFEGFYLDIYVRSENNEDNVYIDYFQSSSKAQPSEVMKAPVFVKIKISADSGFKWISGTSVPDRIRAVPINPIPNIPTFRKRSGKPLNVLKSTVEYFISNQSLLKTPLTGNAQDLMTPFGGDEDSIRTEPQRKINYIQSEKPKTQQIDTTISINRTPDSQGYHPWTRSDNDLRQTIDALLPNYKVKINNEEFPIYEVKKVEKTSRGITIFLASPSEKALIKQNKQEKNFLYISKNEQNSISSIRIKKG
jgi:hypothetical protein